MKLINWLIAGICESSILAYPDQAMLLNSLILGSQLWR